MPLPHLSTSRNLRQHVTSLAAVACLAAAAAGAGTTGPKGPSALTAAALAEQRAALVALGKTPPRTAAAVTRIRRAVSDLAAALDAIGVAELEPATANGVRRLVQDAIRAQKAALRQRQPRRLASAVASARARTARAKATLTGRPGPFELQARPFPRDVFGAYDLAVDSNGAIWVSGSDASLVLEYQSLDPTVPPVIHQLRPGSQPRGLAVAPDGSVYVAETGTNIGGNAIARIGRDGEVREFRAEGVGSPWDIVIGPDGAVWFTEVGVGALGRLDPATGAMRQFPLPSRGGQPEALAVGADGALWGTEVAANRVFRMTTGGKVREFPIPTARSLPVGIAVGRGGNLWVSEWGTGKLLRIAPSGKMREFALDGRRAGPFGLVRAPDGNVWVTLRGSDAVAAVTPAGRVFEYPLPRGNRQPISLVPLRLGSFAVAEFVGNRLLTLTFETR
jgi:virginiamycin B lyase